MLKQFSWPYRLLVLLLVLGLYGFMRQPEQLVNELKVTLESQDKEKWQVLTESAGLQPYGEAVMQGLLKMKYAADWESGNRMGAVNSYYAGKEQLNDLSKQLSGTEGFRHFLCGDLIGFSGKVEPQTEGCWQLDGVVRWVSPVEVRVYFNNPDSGWQSSLLLQRDGLFSWKVAAMELPVEAMLAAYKQQLQE